MGMAGNHLTLLARALLMICVLRLVESAYDEAAEVFNDERDALRANQAQTETKMVSLFVCCHRFM